LKCFLILSPNTPGVTAEARHRITVLALRDEAFYQPSRNGGNQPFQINTVDFNESNVRSQLDECNIETIETEEEVQCFTAKFESLHQASGYIQVVH
jgi:hypothetical protein